MLPLISFGTHNRSGSITYRHISGNTYEFTITTCTKSTSQADRPELEIRWGDGSTDTISRISDEEVPGDYEVQKNIYIGTHTYTGPATYIIEVEDPNRNSEVNNITNSVDKVFCIQTELVISPFIGSPNNSIVLEDCPCPEFGCVNEIYCYNVSAYDPDGDSLSYSLIPCKGVDCLDMSIPEIYQYPNDVGGGIITIDPITGTMCWDFPEIQGVYNIAIKIKEYRAGIFVGSVIQDLQFEISTCPHDPPQLEEIEDTCVFAGAMLDIPVTATDPSDDITIYATGAVFNLPENPATFAELTGNMTVTSNFLWNPTCNEASNSYYSIVLHAKDNYPEIQLKDLGSFQIKVNIPPVEDLTVDPIGNQMNLSWSPPPCDGIVEYRIYRSTDSSSFSESCCEQGAPAMMGYSLVGTSTSLDYSDDDNLIVGNRYCYMITAVNSSGVESCVSEQVCAELKFEIPVLTHVSISTTNTATGEDSIYWSYPKELNETEFPGPYSYRLFRGEGLDIAADELVYTSPEQASIINPDTIYYDSGLNTANNPYTYRVELYNDGVRIGSSLKASSLFIELIPNDNELFITWEENTPWNNTLYEIYREDSPGSGTFSLLNTTPSIGYRDTGLVNGATYCYRIKSIGNYTSDGIFSPLENWSQYACGIPIDLTPPCPPVIEIAGDCDLEETYLNWTNPNKSCADDVTRYNLYFAAFEGDSLTLLTTLESDLDTFFVHKDRGSIAGCYYVTAIDSIQYNNESEPSNLVCIDNCEGFYTLPNIFSPDGNGKNDRFHPIFPIKFVESIELVILNRWGVPVFQTTDPNIFWDGTDQESGERCSDGVYFYSVVVNEIRLAGIVPSSFHGNIQLINGTP